MLSVHTSPLDQPGTGDAGGMNVYVLEVARQLAAQNVEVEIFTRAAAPDLPPAVEAAPGVTVRHVVAGPFEPLVKGALPSELCGFASGVLGTEAACDPGLYDVVHSHYWLSGQVGRITAMRWGVPLVHSMHTMAKVKNLTLADGDTKEPVSRVLGEQYVVDAADRIVANTDDEAHQLVQLYDADPHKVDTVWPGVDLRVFSPGSKLAARHRLGLRTEDVVLLFAGRVQPLKAPDVLVRAAARLVAAEPALRDRLVVPIVGGPSGTGLDRPEALMNLARTLRIDDVVQFHPPVGQLDLADWYRAADITVVPSYSESFGLVALESQACGTPVVAAAVGGLLTAVRHGRSGVLVPGHEPSDWARTLGALVDDPPRLRDLRDGAIEHASRFGWDTTAARTIDVYTDALERRRVAHSGAVTYA